VKKKWKKSRAGVKREKVFYAAGAAMKEHARMGV
jgi:hypothetical protein